MEDISKLSPIKKQMFYVLKDGIKRLLSDDCSDAEVYSMLGRYNAESKGYIDAKSLANYDEAMRIMGLRSRNKFRDLCILHKIEQVKFNNQCVGFKRSEIEDLAYRLSEQNRNAGK